MAEVFHLWWGDEEVGTFRYDPALGRWVRIYLNVRTLDTKPNELETEALHEVAYNTGAALHGQMDDDELDAWMTRIWGALDKRAPSRPPVIRAHVQDFFYDLPRAERRALDRKEFQRRYAAAGGPGHASTVQLLFVDLQADDKLVPLDWRVKQPSP